MSFCWICSSVNKILLQSDFPSCWWKSACTHALTCRVDVSGQREPNQSKPQNLKPAWSCLLCWDCPARPQPQTRAAPTAADNQSQRRRGAAVRCLNSTEEWEKMRERKSCRMWLQLWVPLWKWSDWMQIQFWPNCGRSQSGPPPQRPSPHVQTLCSFEDLQRPSPDWSLMWMCMQTASDGGEPWTQPFQRNLAFLLSLSGKGTQFSQFSLVTCGRGDTMRDPGQADGVRPLPPPKTSKPTAWTLYCSYQ